MQQIETQDSEISVISYIASCSRPGSGRICKVTANPDRISSCSYGGSGYNWQHRLTRHLNRKNTLKTTFSASAVTAVATLYLALSGCTESTQEPTAENPLLATPVPDGMVRGTVAETMNSGGYTYVFIESDEHQLWIAGPKTAVEVGDVLQASAGMPMTNFTSTTLNRTFDVLYFANSMQNLSSRAPAVERSREPVVTDVADVDVPAVEPGQDIAYVYANKDELAGQAISLRGKVVKYNEGILGSELHSYPGRFRRRGRPQQRSDGDQQRCDGCRRDSGRDGHHRPRQGLWRWLQLHGIDGRRGHLDRLRR